MIKDAALSIRITPELKEVLEEHAKTSGLSIASFVERVLAAQTKPPIWTLKDAEVHHGAKSGTRIKLSIAEGMPVALISVKHAEELARELVEAAKAAKRLTK